MARLNTSSSVSLKSILVPPTKQRFGSYIATAQNVHSTFPEVHDNEPAFTPSQQRVPCALFYCPRTRSGVCLTVQADGRCGLQNLVRVAFSQTLACKLCFCGLSAQKQMLGPCAQRNTMSAPANSGA